MHQAISRNTSIGGAFSRYNYLTFSGRSYPLSGCSDELLFKPVFELVHSDVDLMDASPATSSQKYLEKLNKHFKLAQQAGYNTHHLDDIMVDIIERRPEVYVYCHSGRTYANDFVLKYTEETTVAFYRIRNAQEANNLVSNIYERYTGHRPQIEMF